MDRRDSIKSLLVGSLAGGLLVNGCAPGTTEEPKKDSASTGDYGRTPEEKERDAKLKAEQFFNEHEMATIAVLCDIILPKNENFGSATDAGVPDFVEFIVKDLPYHQLPVRGGLMWLDNKSNKQFGKEFKACSDEQQIAIVDQIAYPDKAAPEVEQGVKFFSLMRNLTLTGYYTTKMGLDDLDYKGNVANVWDGVPEDVLEKHGLAYDEEWLAKCVDQSKRADIAQWDDDGNLIS
jgi:hypothetical protein